MSAKVNFYKERNSDILKILKHYIIHHLEYTGIINKILDNILTFGINRQWYIDEISIWLREEYKND